MDITVRVMGIIRWYDEIIFLIAYMKSPSSVIVVLKFPFYAIHSLYCSRNHILNVWLDKGMDSVSDSYCSDEKKHNWNPCNCDIPPKD